MRWGTMVSEEEAGIFCDFGMIRTRVNRFRSWGGVGDNTWRHKHKRKELCRGSPFRFTGIFSYTIVCSWFMPLVSLFGLAISFKLFKTSSRPFISDCIGGDEYPRQGQ